MNTFLGILIPFLGTTLGACCVFFMRRSLEERVQRMLTGFAAGVMVAASVWSLLIPAIEQSEGLGKFAFVPAAVGFWVGILFLLLLDHVIPHLHQNSDETEGPKGELRRTTMMVLAVTLHNIPEGMAVGVSMPDTWPEAPRSAPPVPWPCPWASPFRIFRRVPSFPCPCGRRAWGRGELF